jgi:hypothetical protein
MLLVEIPIEVLNRLSVMSMDGIFHCISHCDHCISFVIGQECHNRFALSKTKKGEKFIENIKTKTKVFILQNNIAK